MTVRTGSRRGPGGSKEGYSAIIKGFALTPKLQSNGLHPFEDDEAGPEPDHPGDTPRVRGDGNTITERRIVVPFLGRWAEPSRPGIDAGSPERPRPVGSPCRHPIARSRGFSVW